MGSILVGVKLVANYLWGQICKILRDQYKWGKLWGKECLGVILTGKFLGVNFSWGKMC